MSTLFWIAVGLIVGWNVPRPQWMKNAQDAVIKKTRDMVGLN